MKKFIKPEITFIEFNEEDIITTSDMHFGGDIEPSGPSSPAEQGGYTGLDFNDTTEPMQ